MNRHEARKQARANTRTVAEFRRLIANMREHAVGNRSRVNPQFDLAWALNIYERALEGRADDEVMVGEVADKYRDRTMRLSRDCPLMINILRDCA